MKSMLALVIALVAVGGVSVTLAQTSKKDETTMTAQTAVGTVKSVSADSLVVAGKTRGKETEWTFAVESTTKIRKAGKDVSATELKPGDPVRVRYMEQAGRSVAQDIGVTTPARRAPAEKK